MKKIMVMVLIITMAAACNHTKEEAVKTTKSHNELMAEMFSKPKVNIKTVGILLYDGYTTLDAMGPYQVLSELMGVNVFFIGRKKGLIANMNGVKTLCDTSIAEVKNWTFWLSREVLKKPTMLQKIWNYSTG